MLPRDAAKPRRVCEACGGPGDEGEVRGHALCDTCFGVLIEHDRLDLGAASPRLDETHAEYAARATREVGEWIAAQANQRKRGAA